MATRNSAKIKQAINLATDQTDQAMVTVDQASDQVTSSVVELISAELKTATVALRQSQDSLVGAGKAIQNALLALNNVPVSDNGAQFSAIRCFELFCVECLETMPNSILKRQVYAYIEHTTALLVKRNDAGRFDRIVIATKLRKKYNSLVDFTTLNATNLQDVLPVPPKTKKTQETSKLLIPLAVGIARAIAVERAKREQPINDDVDQDDLDFRMSDIVDAINKALNSEKLVDWLEDYFKDNPNK